jgi:hypothetical protein
VADNSPAKRNTNLAPVQEDDSVAGTYMVLRTDSERVQRTIKLNLGGDKISPSDLDRIQMGAGGAVVWTRQTLEGEESVPAVEGIMILWRETRQFWPDEYSGGKTPPQCFADDGEHGYGDPGGTHPQQIAGQRAPYDCEMCPNAQFGSDGKRGQACKQSRLVFLLSPENLLPDIMQLPPTSIKPIKLFMRRLASRGIPYTGAVIRFELERTANPDGIKYAQVNPKLVQELTDEQASVVERYAEAIRPSLERIRTDQAGEIVTEDGEGITTTPLNA